MAIERVEWQCPQCGRRYAIPADLPRPSLCPKCAAAGEDEAAVAAAAAPATPPPRPEAAATAIRVATPEPEGIPPELEPAPPLRNYDASRYRRKYPALRIIVTFYRCLAALIVLATIVSFVVGVVGVFQADDQAARWTAAGIAISSLLGGILWSVTVLAFAELIQVALDIEQNTRP